MSRVTDMRNDIVTAVQAITTVKKVTTIMIDPGAVEEAPVVQVILGTESMLSTGRDGPGLDAIDSIVRVLLLGYARQADMETLADELKLKAQSLRLSKSTSATNKWVLTGDPMTVHRDMIPESDFAWVGVEFSVKVFAQDPASL